MLKYIHHFLQTFLKETSKTRPKTRKKRSVDVSQQRAMMRPEMFAIEYNNEGKDTENLKEIDKLKKTYDTIMTRIVNPKIDLPLMRPGRLKPANDFDFLNLKEKHEMIKSLANKIFNERRFSKHSRALLSNDHEERNGKPLPVEDLKCGWTGQPTSKQATIPMVEKPSRRNGSASFSFSETKDVSKTSVTQVNDFTSHHLNKINFKGPIKIQNYKNKLEKSHETSQIEESKHQNFPTINRQDSDKQIITSEKIFSEIYPRSTEEPTDKMEENKLQHNLQKKIIPQNTARNEKEKLNTKSIMSKKENNIVRYNTIDDERDSENSVSFAVNIKKNKVPNKFIKAKGTNKETMSTGSDSMKLKDEVCHELGYQKEVENFNSKVISSNSTHVLNMTQMSLSNPDNSEETKKTMSNKSETILSNENSSDKHETVNEYSVENSHPCNTDGSDIYFYKDEKNMLPKTEEIYGQNIKSNTHETMHQDDVNILSEQEINQGQNLRATFINTNKNCKERISKSSNKTNMSTNLPTKLLSQNNGLQNEVSCVQAEPITKNINIMPKLNESREVKKDAVKSKRNDKQTITTDKDKLKKNYNQNVKISHLKNNIKISSNLKKGEKLSGSDDLESVIDSSKLNSSMINFSVTDSISKNNTNYKNLSEDKIITSSKSKIIPKPNSELKHDNNSLPQLASEDTSKNDGGLTKTDKINKIKIIPRNAKKIKENKLISRNSSGNVHKKYHLKSNNAKSNNTSLSKQNQNKAKNINYKIKKTPKSRGKRITLKEEINFNNLNLSSSWNKNQNQNPNLSVNSINTYSEDANSIKINKVNSNIFPESNESKDVDFKTKNDQNANCTFVHTVKRKKGIDLTNRKLHSKKPILRPPNLQMYGARRNIYTDCNPKTMASSSELNFYNNNKINMFCNMQTRSLITITGKQSFIVLNDRLCPVTNLKRKISSPKNNDNKIQIYKRNITIARNQFNKKSNSEGTDNSQETAIKEDFINLSNKPTNKSSSEVQQVFCFKNSQNSITTDDKYTNQLPEILGNEVKVNKKNPVNILSEEQEKLNASIQSDLLKKEDNVKVLYNKPELAENTSKPNNSESLEEIKKPVAKIDKLKPQSLIASLQKDQFASKKREMALPKKWKSRLDRLKIWKFEIKHKTTSNKSEPTTDVKLNKVVETPSPGGNIKYTPEKNQEIESLHYIKDDFNAEKNQSKKIIQSDNIHFSPESTNNKICEVENTNKIAKVQPNNTEGISIKSKAEYLTNIFGKTPPMSPKDNSATAQSQDKDSIPSMKNKENSESSLNRPSNSTQKWKEFELKLKYLESKLKALEMKSVETERNEHTPKTKFNKMKNVVKNATVIKTANEGIKTNITHDNHANPEIKSENSSQVQTDVKNLMLSVKNVVSDKTNMQNYKNNLTNKVKDLEIKLKHIESQLKVLYSPPSNFSVEKNNSRTPTEGIHLGVNTKNDSGECFPKCSEREKNVTINKDTKTETTQCHNSANPSTKSDKDIKPNILLKSWNFQSKLKFIDKEIKNTDSPRKNEETNQNTELNKTIHESKDVSIKNEVKTNKKDSIEPTLSHFNASSKDLEIRNSVKNENFPKKTDKLIEQPISVKNQKTSDSHNSLSNKNTNFKIKNHNQNHNIITKSENNKTRILNNQDTLKTTSPHNIITKSENNKTKIINNEDTLKTTIPHNIINKSENNKTRIINNQDTLKTNSPHNIITKSENNKTRMINNQDILKANSPHNIITKSENNKTRLINNQDTLITNSPHNITKSENNKTRIINNQDKIKTTKPRDIVISLKNVTNSPKKTFQQNSDQNPSTTIKKLNKEIECDRKSSITLGKLPTHKIAKSLEARDTLVYKKIGGNTQNHNINKHEKTSYSSKRADTKPNKKDTDEAIKSANSKINNIYLSNKILEGHNSAKNTAPSPAKKLTKVFENQNSNQQIIKKSHSTQSLGISKPSKKEMLSKPRDNIKVRYRSTKANKNGPIKNVTVPLTSNLDLIKKEKILSKKISEYKRPSTIILKNLEVNMSDLKNKCESRSPIKMLHIIHNNTSSNNLNSTKIAGNLKSDPSVKNNIGLEKCMNKSRYIIHEGIVQNERLLKPLTSYEKGNIRPMQPDQSKKNLNKNEKNYEIPILPKQLTENVHIYSRSFPSEKKLQRCKKVISKNKCLSSLNPTTKRKSKAGTKRRTKFTEIHNKKRKLTELKIHPIEKEVYEHMNPSTSEFILKKMYPKYGVQSFITSKININKTGSEKLTALISHKNSKVLKNLTK